MKNRFKKLSGVVFSLVLLMALSLTTIYNVHAADKWSFSVSPMKEKILLNPGEQYSSSVTVYVQEGDNTDIRYKVEVEGFYVDENYTNVFAECGTYCEMKDWITIESPTEGRLSPGGKTEIKYTINVPKDAPGGGQYASIIVQGDPWTDESGDTEDDDDKDVAPTIKEEKKIAYTVYAEVAGDVTRQGEITDLDVPSFLLAGDIKGSASVKNTGNVHGDAKYTLQVFPLFSDEEIYTNEEDPNTKTILPDRTRYEETVWEQTPSVGVFNVVYTVEFEGVTAQVSKMVIKCPIWLLFIIIFVIFALIFYFVAKAKARKKAAKRAEKTA